MLEQNLKNIFEEINGGNNLGESITLVGATKTIEVDKINKAISLGLKVVGDNKVQEFNEKSPYISNAEFHFIGHLQTNKVKYLIGKVALIHSVDSLRLAEEISKQSIKKNVTTNVLIEVNVGGELSKSGISPNQVEDFYKEVIKLNNIKVKGLMAMLPNTNDNNLLKNLCLQMRKEYDKIRLYDNNFEFLSIGMSNDYKIAIENGSNMIRLGSKIFGARNYNV